MKINVTRLSANYAWQKVFAGTVALQTGLKTVIEAIDAKLYERGYVYVPFDIPATELAAGTTIELISPVAGQVVMMKTMVQIAIVTGGDVTVKVGTTDIVGLSITVASATTKGTVQTDSIANDVVSGAVVEGSRIQIVPAAAFNGGGAISGYLKIQID